MNNMKIREGRILLDQSIQTQHQLCLKLCIGTQIYKVPNLPYNSFCRRWQIPQEIKLSGSPGISIELELYYQDNGLSKVIGEGLIDMSVFLDHSTREIKIALTYEGLIAGWLYCVLALEDSTQHQAEPKFLCIYKLSFFFLQEEDQNFKILIQQNTSPIYEKEFTSSQRGKTIFPNLKQPIHYSDVISLSLMHETKQFKTVSFLVDHVKRGKTTYFEAWIRNKHNKKMGDLKLEYFLQNLFLENDRKIISRKRLNHAVNFTESIQIKASNKNFQESDKKAEPKEPKQKDQETQEEKLVRTKKTELLEMQKRREETLPRRAHFQHLTQEIRKNQNTISCLRQSKTNLVASKARNLQKTEKNHFYFQNPLEP